MSAEFDTDGWCLFPADEACLAWVRDVAPHAAAIAADPDQRAEWLRCGGTWFAGVNALPNGPNGAVAGGAELRGPAIEEIRKSFGPQLLDPAQISVIYPGYPKPMEGESSAAFNFRRHRDAAHVDGLLPIGPARRRHLREPHSYVLGLPLSCTSTGASPMVVWEGSHHVMRAAFQTALHGIPADRWSEIDLTEPYHAARRQCFEACKRVEIHAQPGEAYLIHRLALHGVAPWQDGAEAPEEGRVIAYFRPHLAHVEEWLA